MSPSDQGLSWLDLGCLTLLLGLCILIAAIDWRRRIIPNWCNAAVAVLGLVHAAAGGGEVLLWAALEGVITFALFWLVRRSYHAFRSVHGLGMGDVKFLGAAGLWTGLQGIAPLVLVACVTGLIYIGVERLRGRAVSTRHAIPFGPFLVLGLVTIVGASLVI